MLPKIECQETGVFFLHFGHTAVVHIVPDHGVVVSFSCLQHLTLNIFPVIRFISVIYSELAYAFGIFTFPIMSWKLMRHLNAGSGTTTR